MKKVYELKMVFVSDPDNANLLEIKNQILSGEMQRDMRDSWNSGIRLRSITFEEVKSNREE